VAILNVLLRLLLLVCLSGLPTLGFSQQTNIYQLKAVFLYNFAQFIQWPKTSFVNTTADINYCTLGNHRVYKSLKNVLKGEHVKGRKFTVRQVLGFEDMDNCHILFFGALARGKTNSLLKSLANNNVLTVGENAEFLFHGGMINLNHKNKRIQIEINLKNVNNTGLSISSKLLRLAKMK